MASTPKHRSGSFRRSPSCAASVITPEIDAPGHAYCFTRLRPDLRHPKLGDSYLDVNNPGTVELMKMIFDEFIPLFDASDVHIGTDEYRRGSANKEEWAALGEGFRQYINIMNRYIRAKHGKTVRIWSGWEHMPGTTQPDTDIIIDMWVSSDAKTKSAAGYQYINSNHGRTYIVPGAGYYGVSNGGLYNNWTPAVFTGNKEKDPAPDDPNLLGGKLHVWNDMGSNGYTMYEIADLTVPTLFVMGEKMWGTKGSATYSDFGKRVEPLQAIPDVRLLRRHVRAPDPETGLVFDSGETLYTLETPADSIPLLPYLGGAGDERKNLEFPWTASMQIKPASGVEQTVPATILGSRIAELQTDLRFTTTKKDPKTKKKTEIARSGLGFSRLDKYTSRPLRSPDGAATREASQVLLPEGRFSTLTFVGSRRATAIYLDGKQVAQFTGTRAQSLCPLETIGALPGRGGGFVGEIKNLKIYDRAIDKYAIARLAGFELPVNIALGCKVTATRSDTPHNLVPEKLTDGNTSARDSRWSSGQTRDPASIVIDLGKVRTVDGATLHWENAFPNNYTVELSTNGKTYRPAIKATGKASADSHKIEPAKARFVRINMENPVTQWGYSLYEIEIFGK
ncbi:MAG: discoidin domain-containing protein [Verrucomicrobia bacterium]|nr:discoidin domain-containing protein [Verrucomicrobiota bacterium]